MIIVVIPKTGGLPVIPAAILIKKEGRSGWYSAHFGPVEKLWIMLYELPWAPGTFLADPNDDSLLRALPAGSPLDERVWRMWLIEASADSDVVGRVVELETVPTRDASDAEPWTVDGKAVTRAAPVMPSRCGHVRSRLLRAA